MSSPKIVDIDHATRNKLKQTAVINPKKVTANFQDNSIAEAVTNEGLFSPDECAKILTLAEGRWKDAKVGKILGSGDEVGRNEEVRNNQNYMLIPGDENFGVFNKLLQIVMEANKQYYRFDIDHFNAVQISKYEVGEYYHKHVDIGPGSMGNRKISLTLQLTDPDTYEGGDLILDFIEGFTASREIGSVTLFPSFLSHRVSAVTKGTRYSLVAWISGENRFR